MLFLSILWCSQSGRSWEEEEEEEEDLAKFENKKINLKIPFPKFLATYKNHEIWNFFKL
jgi:hypothetical protein